MNLRSQLPTVGPLYIAIPGISDAADMASGSTLEVTYRWPARYLLAGVLLMPKRASISLAEAAACLALSAVDDTGEQLTFDTVGFESDAEFIPASVLSGIGAPLAFPGLDYQGQPPYRPRWHPTSKVVEAGDVWRIRVRNTNGAGASIRPWLGFKLEDVIG